MARRIPIFPLLVGGGCMTIILAAIVAVAGVLLGWFSLFGYEHPKRELARLQAQYGEEVRELQALAEANLQYHREKLEKACAELPADAPITREWDLFAGVAELEDGYDHELLTELNRAYVTNPYGMLEASGGSLEDKLALLEQYKDRLTKLEKEVFALRHDPCALREWYEAYLDRLALLQQLEYALEHEVIDLRMQDDADSDIYGHRMRALNLLEARIISYGLRGDVHRALNLLEHLYDLLETARETASLFEVAAAWGQTYRADHVLALLVPLVPWTPQEIRRFEQYLNTPPEDVARQLKMYGAVGTTDRLAEYIPLRVDHEYLLFKVFDTIARTADVLAAAPDEVEGFVKAERAEDDTESGFWMLFRMSTVGMTDMAVEMGRGDIHYAASVMARSTWRKPMFDLALHLEGHGEEKGRPGFR